jgi:hypothetical protein
MSLNKLFYIVFIFIFSAILQVGGVFAQRISQKVEYTLNSGKKGYAIVTYRNIDGKQLPDGKFEFVRDSIIEGEEGLIYLTSQYSGTFKQGAKNGRWDFERSMLQPQKQGRSDGRTIVYDSDGTLHHVQLQFVDGVANGPAQVYEIAIKNSNYSDSSYYNKTIFNQGYFSEKLIAGNKNKQLRIEFGSEGLLNGELRLVDNNNGKKLEHIKFFEDGVLKWHKLILDGKEYNLGYIQLLNGVNKQDTANFRKVMVSFDDERYTLLTKLAIRYQDVGKKDNIDWSKLLLRGERFIRSAGNDYSMFQEDWIWDELPGSSPILGPYITLIERDYPVEEIEILERLKVSYFETKKKLSFYFDDPNLELNRYMSEDMAFYYAVMEQLNRAVDTVGNAIQFCLDTRTKYFDRDKALPIFFSPIVFKSQVNFEFGEKKLKRNYEFPDGVNWSSFNVNQLEENLLAIVKKIDELDGAMKPEVNANQQQLFIADKENELLRLRDSIVYLFSPENKKSNSFHIKYGPKISNFVQSEFKKYAAFPVRTRIDNIDLMLECYRNYMETYAELKKLEDRVKHLETLYTRTTWNPFTFTDMDEIVKERVYNAYRNILLDFVLDNMFGTIECGRLDGKLDNFSKIYRRMIELRDQDTKEIERLLKRVSNPTQIAEILQIKLTF